jgi:hypothetical protein
VYINLEPHVGTSRTGKKVELDQFRIFVDGVSVGYVGKKPGSPINLTKRLSDAEKAEILGAVRWQTQSEPSHVSEPPLPRQAMDETDAGDEDQA